MPHDHSKDNDPNFHEFHAGYERNATPPQTHEHHDTEPADADDLADKWVQDTNHLAKHEHNMQELEKKKQEDLNQAKNGSGADKIIGYAKVAVDSVKEGIESIPKEIYAQKAANARPDIEDLQERQN